MNTTEKITIKEAFKRKYLEDKKVVLKPSPRGANMGITDPKHIAFFQIDQGSTFFCLPRNNRGDLVQIFEDDEERDFFEKELGLDLNVSRPGNHFEKFNIQVIKDASLMHKGESFDMGDLMDNLRVRVLRKNKSVAPSWEERLNRSEYRWAIIDEGEIAKKEELEFNSQADFWMLMAKYNSTPDMKSVLKIYYSSINSSKTVPNDSTKQMLMKDLNSIVEDTKKRETFIKILGDKLFDHKRFVLNAMSAGSIKKDNEDAYSFVGEEETYTFNEMAEKIKELKETDDDLYFQIKSQIEETNK